MLRKKLTSIILVTILVLSLLPMDVLAIEDGWKTASQITEGETKRLIITAPNHREWYKFMVASANQTVNIKIEKVDGSQFDEGVTMLLYDEKTLRNGQSERLTDTLASYSGSRAGEINHRLSEAGTYYIVVRPRNTSSGKHLSPLQVQYTLFNPNAYESETIPPPTPIQPLNSAVSGFQGESISAGAKFSWNPVSNCIGYRIYRSENTSDDSISITDFYITDNKFVDVNVQPNKTYYYTIRAVIAEARPFDGIQEQLGEIGTKITINTPDIILGDNLVPPTPNAVRKFILMTLDNPYMSLNGEHQEIDPGRGTTPLILNSRTLVPIRAIVEGMGGSVAWNDSTREITMKYQQNTVKMTLDKNDFTVNGTAKKADVPPTAINGRTLVPVRFVAESLGCAIDWLNSTRQVVIVYY